MTDSSSLRMVVLVSGNGSNLQAILDHIDSGDLDARIEAVISDQPQAFGLQRARNAGIPAIVVDGSTSSDAAAFFIRLRHEVDRFDPQLVVLAGFMRILPAEFFRGLEGKIMNIHPSLLPKYRGLNTHQRALEAGDRQHGATVHMVTPELDAGPVIETAVVDVLPDDDAESLQKRVLEQEHIIYSRAIQRFARGELATKSGGN